MRLVYLIGGPATGKTTLTAAIFHGWATRPGPTIGRLRTTEHTYGPITVVELGAPRDTFGGTDALPMNVQPDAVDWISRQPAPAVYAEGDRLANDGFLTAARDAGYTVSLFHLSVDRDTLTARRRHRTQDPTWVTGRDTKAARLADRWEATRLDGTADPGANAARVLAALIG